MISQIFNAFSVFEKMHIYCSSGLIVSICFWSGLHQLLTVFRLAFGRFLKIRVCINSIVLGLLIFFVVFFMRSKNYRV